MNKTIVKDSNGSNGSKDEKIQAIEEVVVEVPPEFRIMASDVSFETRETILNQGKVFNLS